MENGKTFEALVTSQSSSPEKQMAIIIAEIKVTGNVLRADVFVNRINRISNNINNDTVSTQTVNVHNYNTLFAAKQSYYFPNDTTNYGLFNRRRFRGPKI